jgi:hypothetical protein
VIKPVSWVLKPANGRSYVQWKTVVAQHKIGVEVSWTDYLVAAATGILITVRMLPYSIAARIPTISDAADRSLVRKLTKQLARYGHAEFTTNAAAYASKRQTK